MTTRERADWLAELYFEHCELDCGRCVDTQPACHVGQLIDFLLRAAGTAWAGHLVRLGALR